MGFNDLSRLCSNAKRHPVDPCRRIFIIQDSASWPPRSRAARCTRMDGLGGCDTQFFCCVQSSTKNRASRCSKATNDRATRSDCSKRDESREKRIVSDDYHRIHEFVA